jgi:hypothetical protein
MARGLRNAFRLSTGQDLELSGWDVFALTSAQRQLMPALDFELEAVVGAVIGGGAGPGLSNGQPPPPVVVYRVFPEAYLEEAGAHCEGFEAAEHLKREFEAAGGDLGRVAAESEGQEKMCYKVGVMLGR